jgi:Cu(I)/Ag(I) efflux system membrane fusion protein
MKPWLVIAVSLLAVGCTRSSGAPSASSERKPLFYRNPMNPQDTSPLPKKDSMGMDYVPVYADEASKPSERKPLFYRNPMNPQDTSPLPKKDSMGMDYVPVYPDVSGGPRPPSGMSTVQIDPSQQHLIGLKTATAKRITFDATIRTTGRVAFDETRLVKVQPRFEGFIEKLYANFSGKYVNKGEPLATIYSPELLATEQELLLAKRAEGTLTASGLPDAAEAARSRLRLFGISDAEIARLEESGKAVRALPLAAPISGFVMAKNVVQGARVGPSDALFDIADLSVVWVIADVYEYELPRLRVGQKATLTLSYWPDKSWRGRVSFVFPTVDEKTRTVKVRIEVENPRTELKPEMFADVNISAPARQSLVVPEDAIIDTGTRKVVFVALGEGKLAPREVQTGDTSHGVVEIRSGLHEGDEVATSANFLLDSESRLKSAVNAMEPSPDGGRP